jgi:hypothetical protein
MNIEDIVIGENFKNFSDIVIDQKNLMLNIPRNYNKNNIVFCKTDYLGLLFQEVSNLDIDIILISHQSDYEINEEIWRHKPACIKKWYAQNVNFKHSDLIPIPIGLENHIGFSRGSSIDVNFISNLELVYNNSEKITTKIYSNFGSTHNNRDNVRTYLDNNKLSFNDKFGLPYSEYMKSMSNYLFIASPRGNGIDCHRTWEALLMGCIPIVERHFMYDNYNLPIIQIDSWEDILNKNILNEYKIKYSNKELFSDISQLTMDYWKKIIFNDFIKFTK